MDTKLIKTMFVRTMYIMVILAVALSVTGSASAQVPSPWLIAFPENEAVEGWEWPPGAVVHLTIDNALGFERQGTAAVTPWGDTRTYVRFDFVDAYDLKVGDVVTLTDGVTARMHIVQNLAVTAVDADADTVAGTADIGAVVQVWPHGFGKYFIEDIAEEGTWLANFGAIDFHQIEETGGRSQIILDGNATAVDWYVPNPRFTIFPEWEWFDGMDWPDGATVTITVAGKSVCGVTKESLGGFFFNGGFPEGCDVVAGDVVTFTYGETVRTHTVQNLAITDVDMVANTVGGTADSGAEVHVWPHETGEQLQATVDASGIWQVDFTGVFDLVEGTCGRSQILVGDNATAVDWCVPNPWLIALPENEAVVGWEWPEGATVHLTIDNPTTEASPDLERNGTMAVTTWGDPRTFVRFDFADAYDLKVGDVVMLTDGETARTHIVQNLAVTAVDADADTVAGTAYIGAVVQVWPHGFDQIATVEVTTGDNGTWLAEFPDDFDLVEGMGGRSQILDKAGNATAVDWSAPNPRLTVSITDDWFRAEEFPPGAELTISIYTYQGGDLLWEKGRMTDGNGFVFVGSWETNVDLVPGMFLVVSSEAVTKDIELEPVLLFVFDTEEDFLAGSAPPERHVWVGTGNESSWCSMDVTSGSDGAWEADFASQPCDVMADMWGAAQVFDGDGDATEANPGFPRGSHDYDTGAVPSWACNAGGWVFDPDDQGRPVSIRILSDGNSEPVLELVGNEDGNRGYEAHLWGLISAYETHEITVEAYDQESGTWRALENTPRPLTCRTYDIYAFDPRTGETRQITDMRDTDEYNPSWSPNGKKVAYDVVKGDGSPGGVYVTDVKTGVSAPLVGAEDGGNDAVWSPNGKLIAFDRHWVEENPGLYIVSSAGGVPTLVRSNAISADWAPNGKRLVFQQPSDGSIRTVPLDGGGGGESLIAASGANPVWSPDGKWIAYENNGDIWKVRVNVQGVKLGEPIQVTTLAAWDGQPTWSIDSQTIAFHSGLSRDFDLWTVPAAGGMPTWLTGAPEFGDYHPAYAKNGPSVAYASFSPEGQAARTWVAAFTYDLPAVYWSEGKHTYHFEAAGLDNTIDFSFDVGEQPFYDGTVLLRPAGSIRARTGEECIFINAINPNQQTQFHVGWTADGTYPEALVYYENLMAKVSWDGGMPVDLVQHEIFPFTSQVDWAQYVCTYTAGE